MCAKHEGKHLQELAVRCCIFILRPNLLYLHTRHLGQYGGYQETLLALSSHLVSLWLGPLHRKASVQPGTQPTDWFSYLETSFPVWVLLLAWWGALSSACLSCVAWLNSLNCPQASLIFSHHWGLPVAPTGVPSLLCPPRWDVLGWHWGQCPAPIGLPGSPGWCQLVLRSTAAVGAPPTAFLVLDKCHAQETGEIKVWQGIPVHGCICIFVPLSHWPFNDLQLGETVVVFRCCFGCLSVISVSCYMKSPYCWKPLFVAVMLFNCTARCATKAWLFSEMRFSTICEKSPVTMYWGGVGLQIHQSKAIQDKECCKIEVCLWESSQTGPAVNHTSKKKKREFLAGFEVPYSNATSFRWSLFFSLVLLVR